MLPRSNRLLDALSPELKSQIQSMSRAVDLPAGAKLYQTGEEPTHVYLLLGGVASIAVSVADGSCAEVGMAGMEGLIGAHALLGPHVFLARCFMQIGGPALRIPLADARRLFNENAEFHTRVLQYLQADAQFTTQMSACNRLHQATERTARWLLTAADRSGSDTLMLTQESLSQMLGTRRTTIALVAGEMQRKGMLRYRRGHIKIANREALTARSCDCYGVTRRVLDTLYN